MNDLSMPWIRFSISTATDGASRTVTHGVRTSSGIFTSSPTNHECFEITLAVTVDGGRPIQIQAKSSSRCEIVAKTKISKPFKSEMRVKIRQYEDSPVENYLFSYDSTSLQPEAGESPMEALPTDLDALKYIASYPDLCQAFGVNVSAARDHFRFWGDFEGRKLLFDPHSYASHYSDLKGYLNDKRAACEHYIRHGCKEGRLFQF
jgi:hypothetical protein